MIKKILKKYNEIWDTPKRYLKNNLIVNQCIMTNT